MIIAWYLDADGGVLVDLNDSKQKEKKNTFSWLYHFGQLIDIIKHSNEEVQKYIVGLQLSPPIGWKQAQPQLSTWISSESTWEWHLASFNVRPTLSQLKRSEKICGRGAGAEVGRAEGGHIGPTLAPEAI